MFYSDKANENKYLNILFSYLLQVSQCWNSKTFHVLFCILKVEKQPKTKYYSQQKQDQDLTVTLIMNSFPRSELNSLSCVQLSATTWAVAHQAPQSMGFSRQEYWSGLPFPSPVYLPNTHTHTHTHTYIRKLKINFPKKPKYRVNHFIFLERNLQVKNINTLFVPSQFLQ